MENTHVSHCYQMTATHQTSFRSHRNFRRCPAGLQEPCSGQRRRRRRKSCGRNTSRSLLRRFRPPTRRRALRDRRAEPRYTPSRFLAVELRCLLRAPGVLCVLHVSMQLCESDAVRAARGFYSRRAGARALSAELHQLEPARRPEGGWAGLTGSIEKFPGSRNKPGKLQRKTERRERAGDVLWS